jgi:hypothetical protein
MLGHPSLLLRDIAVNESDQERVSDSGAIRSGLVPQLKHSAMHRRFPSQRTKRAVGMAQVFFLTLLGMYPGFGRGTATAGLG